MTTKRKVSWLTGLILLIVATAAAQTARSQTTPPSAEKDRTLLPETAKDDQSMTPEDANDEQTAMPENANDGEVTKPRNTREKATPAAPDESQAPRPTVNQPRRNETAPPATSTPSAPPPQSSSQTSTPSSPAPNTSTPSPPSSR